jgi:hypothetical protein
MYEKNIKDAMRSGITICGDVKGCEFGMFDIEGSVLPGLKLVVSEVYEIDDRADVVKDIEVYSDESISPSIASVLSGFCDNKDNEVSVMIIARQGKAENRDAWIAEFSFFDMSSYIEE